MTYKLYNRDGSGGFVVEAALALAGAQFDLIALDSVPGSALPETFREINPWRQVPVLMTPDGAMMTESAAMLTYIAQAFPGGDVGPQLGTPEHASFLRWVVFLSANVYETTLRRIYPERYTTEAAEGAGIRAAAIERNDNAFGLLDGQLNTTEFLLGDQMSLADVYLAMLFSWHPGKRQFAQCEALTHRVARHPVVAPIWQRNFDHRSKVKWGRV